MDAPRIWVPKLKIVEAELKGPVGGVEGFFKMEVVNRHGRVTRSLGPWKQLITDQAMNGLFYFNTEGGGHQRCHVGTGSPTFTNASTGLANPVAETNTTYTSSTVADLTGTNGYRIRHSVTKEFGLGAVVATLTEVGMFSNSGNTSGHFLDLIRDSDGVPTSFPVTADDQLRVTHILDRYPFLGTTSGTFMITGAAGSGAHDYECNMASLGQSGMGSATGHVFGAANNSQQQWGIGLMRDCSALGANTANAPVGAVALGGASSYSSQLGTSSNDGTNWYRSMTATFGLTTANHANGISGFKFHTNIIQTAVALKGIIDPPIPKFAGSVQRILTLSARYGITRV